MQSKLYHLIAKRSALNETHGSRGMSNHMCLDMDPGGKMMVGACCCLTDEVVLMGCVSCGDSEKKKTTSRGAAVVADARAWKGGARS